jgi:hypothetical protein
MEQEINNWNQWAEKIINGVGGFKDWKRYEHPLFKFENDIEIVIWTINCLIEDKVAFEQLTLFQKNKCNDLQKNDV